MHLFHSLSITLASWAQFTSKLPAGFPWWLSSKECACSAGDLGSILGSGRSPGEGNGNLLQYSCLGNPMDTGAWQATVRGVGHNLATKPPPPLWKSTPTHTTSTEHCYRQEHGYISQTQSERKTPNMHNCPCVSSQDRVILKQEGGESGWSASNVLLFLS